MFFDIQFAWVTVSENNKAIQPVSIHLNVGGISMCFII